MIQLTGQNGTFASMEFSAALLFDPYCLLPNTVGKSKERLGIDMNTQTFPIIPNMLVDYSKLINQHATHK